MNRVCAPHRLMARRYRVAVWWMSVGGGRLLKGLTSAMVQQGQTFELACRGRGGERLWAYCFRTGGRDSRAVLRLLVMRIQVRPRWAGAGVGGGDGAGVFEHAHVLADVAVGGAEGLLPG
jgi:hypothetical protein